MNYEPVHSDSNVSGVMLAPVKEFHRCVTCHHAAWFRSRF